VFIFSPGARQHGDEFATVACYMSKVLAGTQLAVSNIDEVQKIPKKTLLKVRNVG